MSRSPARAIGLVLVVLGLAFGLFAAAVLNGWVFGVMGADGNRSMTWPASLLALLISGGGMIVLFVAGLVTWIIGVSRASPARRLPPRTDHRQPTTDNSSP
jgi:hypothetical protein